MTRRFARILTRIDSRFCTPCGSPVANGLSTAPFPPRDRKAYHRHLLDEVLQERVPLRPPRSNARGVKRKMSGYPQVRCRTPQVCCQPIILIVK